jgi:hypothetical protein
MAVDPVLVGELAVRGMFKQKMLIVPGKLATLISYLLRILPVRFLVYMFYNAGKKKHHSSIAE